MNRKRIFAFVLCVALFGALATSVYAGGRAGGQRRGQQWRVQAMADQAEPADVAEAVGAYGCGGACGNQCGQGANWHAETDEYAAHCGFSCADFGHEEAAQVPPMRRMCGRGRGQGRAGCCAVSEM
ncbi:MAG: hypothetical protein FWG87_07135 [Defluviitaleaceae bacterium]|nr:hypothetical protein [Defluviitaleaceae bacterium]